MTGGTVHVYRGQRKIPVSYSSGQNKVNVPFAFRFRATVLAFKRNAKRTLNGRKKDATKRIRFDIVGRNLPFYGTIDMCVPGRYSRRGGVATARVARRPSLSLFT